MIFIGAFLVAFVVAYLSIHWFPVKFHEVGEVFWSAVFALGVALLTIGLK